MSKTRQKTRKKAGKRGPSKPRPAEIGGSATPGVIKLSKDILAYLAKEALVKKRAIFFER